MSKLEELIPDAHVRGIIPNTPVTVVNTKWVGTDVVNLTYRDSDGTVGEEVIFRDDESRIEIVNQERPWSFVGDGKLFRLVSEANRIRLAHLFDPLLAVHTSEVEPLPHQITAVYDDMLNRLPLRFLLADDPGAGKTIMAGLLIKELIARGDLQRCLIVCPGSLVEQWQDELSQRFGLKFEIATTEGLKGPDNWFLNHNLVIGRLDKLARDEGVQEKLNASNCSWDLIVCDEAHKMSATFFGDEVSKTKRYRLGELLSPRTRHFLLMTATPHNGKEKDFQAFMSLLDPDRFEVRHRAGLDSPDVSDLMRRMTKEELVRFDNTPLLPERIAETVPYKLSDTESELYTEVTTYVREEFNRAEALQNNKRKGNIGFALTILQRRLASSPAAIYHSLRRRRQRLQDTLGELETSLDERNVGAVLEVQASPYDEDDFVDMDEAPGGEIEQSENLILDRATAASTIDELKAEISTLTGSENLARDVLRNGGDRKWEELAALLAEELPPDEKLVIFTEHVDTLNYLKERIEDLWDSSESIVTIHGSMRWEARLEVQDSFRNDPRVRILLATDAAGEGINLQHAHLMVNYDLPWNPNRIEQRFGRIHRIGQREVCRLWNLVAVDTREGKVYELLLDKLDEARVALGGKVFDVMGKLHFEGRQLRHLLEEAVRYGERPEVRGRLTTAVENAFDHDSLRELWEEKALARDTMDSSRLHRVREDMERAEASRLQPHYIKSFFLEAFRYLGGRFAEREPGRFSIDRVPERLRNRGYFIPARYSRIVFDKSLRHPDNQVPAEFVSPGHPLLAATIDVILEIHRVILREGAVLVDDNDSGKAPRSLFYLDHRIQDGTRTASGQRREISRRILHVELDKEGHAQHPQYAPYLDYRPLREGEPEVKAILARPECAWITKTVEEVVNSYALTKVVPAHRNEVKERKLDYLAKTEAAVKERLTEQIGYWDHRAEELATQEGFGKSPDKLNSGEARKRSEELRERLRSRLERLELERQIAPLPPNILGCVLIVPSGLLSEMMGTSIASEARDSVDTQAVAARARGIVMDIERELGFDPTDREADKVGYDIESKDPATGKLRFIEVKGRRAGANTITATRNEILYSLNKPEDYILAMVEFTEEGQHRARYLRHPFQTEPDFDVTSVNYNFSKLLERAEEPR